MEQKLWATDSLIILKCQCLSFCVLLLQSKTPFAMKYCNILNVMRNISLLSWFVTSIRFDKGWERSESSVYGLLCFQKLIFIMKLRKRSRKMNFQNKFIKKERKSNSDNDFIKKNFPNFLK